jgi:dCTP deaminase
MLKMRDNGSVARFCAHLTEVISMFMSDVQITQAIHEGGIRITPYDDKMLQPASYDLKIGRNAATVPKNGDPRINLEEEGVLFIPAYAPAVVWTKEELALTTEYVGHFGLKSKLARRGLIASVGIQVDPGFEGPLSVTLLNMTPTPLSLNYGEDFLTLEFEKLMVPASKAYSGDYQGRKTFTSEELDPVMGFKGHAITDVVKGFDDIRDAVKEVALMAKKLDLFMDQHRQEIVSMQELNRSLMTENNGLLKEMKRLVSHIVGERDSTVILRTLTREEARAEILTLFKSASEPLYYSDIAERLQIDLEQVLDITNELEREGLIGEAQHGRTQ